MTRQQGSSTEHCHEAAGMWLSPERRDIVTMSMGLFDYQVTCEAFMELCYPVWERCCEAPSLLKRDERKRKI